MKIAYIFDVDGTLVESGNTMSDVMRENFLNWCKSKRSGGDIVCVASGATRERLYTQLGNHVLEHLDILLTESGGIIYEGSEVIRLPPPVFSMQLISALKSIKSDFPDTCPSLEVRNSMINLSMVGHNVTSDLRGRYSQWELLSQERLRVVTQLSDEFPEYTFSLGGAVSIDVSANGVDKSMILERILPSYTPVFFGDRVHKFGNDHSIASAVMQRGGKVFQVESPSDVYRIILKDM